MKRAFAIVGAILVTIATPAFAHRVDEYLQATTLLVSNKRVNIEMRLAPGMKVATTVIDSIDADRDGVISESEEREYGQRVIDDVSLTLDKNAVPLRLVATHFARVNELKSGLGEIQLALEANLPSGGAQRQLVFTNHHRSAISAYLMNSLVPAEPSIRITNQKRDYLQTVYTLDYVQSRNAGASISFGSLMRWTLLLAGLAFALIERVTKLRRR